MQAYDLPQFGITPGHDDGTTASEAAPATLRVWSHHATAMHLVLVDAMGAVQAQLPMQRDGDVWQVSTDRLVPGQRYALSVAGPSGGVHRFDPDRYVLDPYARHVEQLGDPGDARWVGVVVAPDDAPRTEKPATPNHDSIIYELHVKGFTKRAEFLPEEVRGTYAGLAHPNIIAHLRRLGITAVELLPVQAFASEGHLRRAGTTNYWGYNTLGFFAPHADYATAAARAAGPEAVAREFRDMVDALHEAGIEVLLDVVYNHTADEGDTGEPVLFAGIDRASYYRHLGGDELLDVTGCGNSVDTNLPAAQRLVLDSLRYWATEFGVDGFRFDLAVTLGRGDDQSFSGEHPLLRAITADPVLRETKLIAEPWDVGTGGWQTGNFPGDEEFSWGEWNDEYRDRVRSFWVHSFAQARITGQHRQGLGELSTAIAGSSDRFNDARGPLASVNFVTAHDGFTLRDLVSYNVKHNLLNGELGRDGTNDNRSFNFGREGESEDPLVERSRHLAMRNLLGTLLTSAGVPMLVAGDEFGRTQHGNNNPYNQDNAEFGWVDWDLTNAQEALIRHVRRLTSLRRAHPALRPRRFNHTNHTTEHAARLDWFDPLGEPMHDWQWHTPSLRSLQYIASTKLQDDGRDRVLVMINGVEDPAPFRLPDFARVTGYRLLWDSSADHVAEIDSDAMRVLAPGSRLRVAGPSMRVFEAITGV
ncbi:glycogen debranching protein GlgX [Gulosibacter faecalis]|uniref:Glycogen debranching protein GlgX n=1 Tax=Gulosibacter faecalis TaxID=272240 RepID=A0ABW5UWB7_9MICO|nr:glycogen debranching protein GlgX [Gulosibacter faecalis]